MKHYGEDREQMHELPAVADTAVPGELGRGGLEALRTVPSKLAGSGGTGSATITKEQLQQIKEALIQLWESVKAAILEAAERIRAWLLRLLLKRYVSRRVYHLAFHARKARVRKKNLKRLFRA